MHYLNLQCIPNYIYIITKIMLAMQDLFVTLSTTTGGAPAHTDTTYDIQI